MSLIVARAPYRISFFGGGTDYPDWYREEGGQVLSTSIDKYCYVTCRYFPRFFPAQHRIVEQALPVERRRTLGRVLQLEREVPRQLGEHLRRDRPLVIFDLAEVTGRNTQGLGHRGLVEAGMAADGADAGSGIKAFAARHRADRLVCKLAVCKFAI